MLLCEGAHGQPCPRMWHHRHCLGLNDAQVQDAQKDSAWACPECRAPAPGGGTLDSGPGHSGRGRKRKEREHDSGETGEQLDSEIAAVDTLYPTGIPKTFGALHEQTRLQALERLLVVLGPTDAYPQGDEEREALASRWEEDMDDDTRGHFMAPFKLLYTAAKCKEILDSRDTMEWLHARRVGQTNGAAAT
jgi:hypothetical protein